MSLRFLADESCDFGVVRSLRSAGFTVTAVSEVASGADDNAVIDLANHEKSILITEDKDFGQLVYASGHESVGVILLRYPFHSRKRLFKDIPACPAKRRRTYWSLCGTPTGPGENRKNAGKVQSRAFLLAQSG
ncbi:MAG: hypothetical protein A4E57_00822 [Syntrophorhabdaceae bacterium PtaU1.Bin034]|jgi:predicted nuclease of predicted toxin-antitoxin system|nr:MAG: hypothetical protein A4E57_00822 [Syntrophorhabdaceae bacterium PtaU1.Bin034]